MRPRILVTAGPTREYLDPVRFISNPSSGKMGYLIAKEAQARGCHVLLVLGPSSIKPDAVKTIRVVSALDMFKAVQKNFVKFDILIMTAAVSDFRPKKSLKVKIKKAHADQKIELIPNPDILKWAGAHKGTRLIVGFAAETNNVYKNAHKKLVQKKLDMIVANEVGSSEIGFESDKIKFIIIEQNRNSISKFRIIKKEKLAKELMKLILDKVNLCC